MSPRALMLTPDAYYLDRRIVQEAGSLAARGWPVDIYPTNPAIPIGEEELPALVRLLANPRRGAVAAGLPLRLRYFKRFLSESARPLHRLADALQHWLTDRAARLADANFAPLAALERYDVVFAHDIPVLPLAARLKERWGARLVCDLHEIYPEMEDAFSSRTARRYWRSVEAGFLGRADGILCVNAAVEDYLRRNYAPRAGCAVVLNAVPFRRPAAGAGRAIRELFGIPAGRRVLLFVGALLQGKNLETLAAGFGRARLDGWALAILGDGPLAPRLERLARREGFADRVHVGRHVPQHRVLEVAASADAAVLPYQAVGYNHLICTPNKLFEYIQARLPILSSRLPMIEKLLAEHGNGVSADFSTPASVAAALRKFVSEDLPRITPEVLERAARSVCWEKEEPKLLEIVAGALGTSFPSGA